MKLAPPGDLELVRAEFLDAQRHVGLNLTPQAVPEVAAGDELAFFTGERRGVRLEDHANRRLIDRNDRERHRLHEVRDGLPDLGVLDPGERHDVSRADLLDLDALQPEVRERLRHADLRHRAVLVDQVDGFAALYLAAPHAPDHDPPEIIRVVEVGDDHLERLLELHRGRRNLPQNRLEKLVHVVLRIVQIAEHLALTSDGVQDREIELLVRCPELGHEVERQIHDLLGPGVLTVYLVDDHDRLEAELDGLPKHEARLRHRTLGRVHEEQATVDHPEDALDLAAEVRVARGIDYVDLDALVLDGGVLGEDRNAPLLLQNVRVHRALGDLLPVPELHGLREHPVHERRLPVVDVCNDSNVAIFHESLLTRSPLRRWRLARPRVSESRQ